MSPIDKPEQFHFHGWDKIEYQGKQIGSSHGKTYFYYDKNQKKLYYGNFTKIGLFFYNFSHFWRKVSRKNILFYLKNKQVLDNTTVDKKTFRKTIEIGLQKLTGRMQLTPLIWEDGTFCDDGCKEKFLEMYQKNLLLPNWDGGTYKHYSALAIACANGLLKETIGMIKKDFQNKEQALKQAIYRDQDTLITEIAQQQVVNHALLTDLLHFSLEMRKETIALNLIQEIPLDGLEKKAYVLLSESLDKKLYHCLEALVKKGLDVNAQADITKNTCLHTCCGYLEKWWSIESSSDILPNLSVDKEAVEILVRNGANLNATDYAGNTPLHIAAEMGYREIVQILCSNGADTTLKTLEGKTAADIAKEKRH